MKDQTGRDINISQIPARIVSVVPSQTELLFDLGLNDRIVGITKFCVHPEEEVKEKLKIGGTKNLDLDKIRSLKPDLIIANKEENKQEEIEMLMKEYPVWISDVKTLDDALEMIQSVGKFTNREKAAHEISNKISDRFSNLQRLMSNVQHQTAYLIWHKPMMTVGGDTFISHMMKRSGYKNVFEGRKRYPEITETELKGSTPDIILLSSEPFPFKQKHAEHYQSICPAAKIMLVDGQMFSWYGSRLQYSPTYFSQLIHSSGT